MLPVRSPAPARAIFPTKVRRVTVLISSRCGNYFVRRFSGILSLLHCRHRFGARQVIVGLCICSTGSMSCASGSSVAVFYALDKDFVILSSLADSRLGSTRIAGTTVTTLKFGERETQVAKMGSGCVETAASVQAVLARFTPELVISIGPAGSISDDVPVGRWYLAADIIGFQAGTATPTGTIPRKAAVLKGFDPKSLGEMPKLLKDAHRTTVASGELFVASLLEREKIASQTKAQLVDMNLFGLAATCARSNVPWIAWKISSDRADDDAPKAFEKFVDNYTGEGATAIAELIRQLPPNPASLQSYDQIQEAIKAGE